MTKDERRRRGAARPGHTARRVRIGFACALAGSATVGLVGMAGMARAEVTCATYAALAAADGVRTVASSPGFSPTDADALGPAAQAQVDDIAGSNAFAGAPYSEAGAGNAGAGNVDATQIPTFAISSHPSRPEDVKSSPGLTLEARSEMLLSAAEASGGPPATDAASFGRASATAAASCVDGVVTATADSRNDVVNIAGVLGLGSVRSHAEAGVDGDGNLSLDGSMTIEGATVLGQGVEITDEGVVFGDSPIPLPDNPLAAALDDAGIQLRYLAVDEDEANGQVLAPGLEIIVSDSGGSIPGGASTTYTFGRAYARATAASTSTPPFTASPVPDDPAAGAGSEQPTPTVARGVGGAPSVTTPDSPSAFDGGSQTEDASSTVGSRVATVGSSQIADVSMENVYPALVVGALVLSASWLLFEYLGVRLRWT